MKKGMNSPVDVSHDEQPRKLSYAEIRSLYFDSVVDIFIKDKYPDCVGWEYDYTHSPLPRQRTDFVRIAVSFPDSKTFINLNMCMLFNNKATKADVLFIIDSKTKLSKKLYEQCIIAHKSGSGMIPVDVSSYDDNAIQDCLQMLYNDGITAASNEDGMLFVSGVDSGGEG